MKFPRIQLLLLIAVVSLGMAIYVRAFHDPLIFDDLDAIKNNPSVHRLWPLAIPLRPPDDSPLAVRPLVNLSLAVNYAIHQTRPAGYRAVNLALHLAAALLLFGVIRRSAVFVGGGAGADLLAAASALLWLAHPLNSEAVVYITQRTELMAALFYLLTLYAAIRGWQATSGKARNIWFAVSALACGAGMASKEVMVSAPLLVLLYDRTLVSGTFASALRRGRGLYAALAASWGLLIFLLLTQKRGDSAGFHLGVSAMEYLQTQAGVILWYLRLCFWPHPLTVAHDWPLSRSLLASLPAGLVVIALLGATVALLKRRSWAGLLGAGFFLILAPTSSVVPIVTEIAAERRMYLPAAAAVVLTVYLAHRGLALAAGRLGSARRLSVEASVAAAALIALATLSVARVSTYESLVSLWADAARQFPANAVAAHNLAGALLEEDRYPEALAQVDRAIALDSTNWTSHTLRGQILAQMNQPEQAEASFRRSLQLSDVQFEGHYQLGRFYIRQGRHELGIAELRQAIRIKPEQGAASNLLGAALFMLHRQAGASPTDGNLEEAMRCFRQAIRLDPTQADPHLNLGAALADLHQFDQAIEEYRRAIQLKPDLAQAHLNLGNALAATGRMAEAVAAFRQAARIAPGDAEAWLKLGMALDQFERPGEAIEAYRKALAISPNQAIVHNRLGVAYARSGMLEQAADEFRVAVALRPDYAEARENLEKAMKNPRP